MTRVLYNWTHLQHGRNHSTEFYVLICNPDELDELTARAPRTDNMGPTPTPTARAVSRRPRPGKNAGVETELQGAVKKYSIAARYTDFTPMTYDVVTASYGTSFRNTIILDTSGSTIGQKKPAGRWLYTCSDPASVYFEMNVFSDYDMISTKKNYAAMSMAAIFRRMYRIGLSRSHYMTYLSLRDMYYYPTTQSFAFYLVDMHISPNSNYRFNSISPLQTYPYIHTEQLLTILYNTAKLHPNYDTRDWYSGSAKAKNIKQVMQKAIPIFDFAESEQLLPCSRHSPYGGL